MLPLLGALSCEAPPSPGGAPADNGPLEPAWIVYFSASDPSSDYGHTSLAVATAPDGATYLLATVYGPVVATGGLALPTDRLGDLAGRIVLVRVSPAGRPEWARLVAPGWPAWGPFVVAADAGGEAYSLTPVSLRKHSPQGDLLWTLPFEYSISIDDDPLDLAVDRQGNAYVLLTSRLIKISADGIVLWSVKETESSVLAADDQGHLLLGGNQVKALSAEDGALLWKADVLSHDDISVYPGTGGELVTISRNLPDLPTLITVSRLAHDGAVQWQEQLLSPSEWVKLQVAAVDPNRALVIGQYLIGEWLLLVDRHGQMQDVSLAIEEPNRGSAIPPIAGTPSGNAVVAGAVYCPEPARDPYCRNAPAFDNDLIALIELP